MFWSNKIYNNSQNMTWYGWIGVNPQFKPDGHWKSDICLFQTSEQKYPMKIHLKHCTNLFPRKLITCPAFHVHSDSPPIPVFLFYSEYLHVHRQKLDTWMLKKMCCFIILVVHFIIIYHVLCEVINTMISEIDDLCSSTFGLTSWKTATRKPLTI